MRICINSTKPLYIHKIATKSIFRCEKSIRYSERYCRFIENHINSIKLSMLGCV